MTVANSLAVWNVIIYTVIVLKSVQLAVVIDHDLPRANEWFANELNPLDSEKPKRDLNVVIEEFMQKRKQLINDEMEQSFGNDIQLNGKEQLANQIIMTAKRDELRTGFFKPHLFNPSRHIFDTLSTIKQSKLFQMIKNLPKGGILHIHESAMCSTNFLVSLTYWPDLWIRISSNHSARFDIVEFRFLRAQPTNQNKQITRDSTDTNASIDSNDSVWRLVKDVRTEMGASAFDEHVRSMFTLYDTNVNPMTQFQDINDVWIHFLGIFDKIRGILAYAPIRRAYFRQALKELYDDSVQYVEIRTSIPEVHDLDGNLYSEDKTFEIYMDVLNEFKREYPLFIGAKFIYAKNKYTSIESVPWRYFETATQFHLKYPQLMVGFDLVGQEDKAPPLMSYAQHIVQLPDDLKLFFHAGETNWFGSVDENLIDAVLLGSRRIGHGYALAKHPKVIDLVKSNNIAVEVNPISNQVLKLVDDFRNHPASMLFANNVAVVISSDDPSFWEVTPLSHDFYVAFLGIASQHSDLRTLKQLALNSILYSSLKGYEKLEALMKWHIKWDKFINDLTQNLQ